MWKFVSQIQATLDEAAGIDTRGGPSTGSNDANEERCRSASYTHRDDDQHEEAESEKVAAPARHVDSHTLVAGGWDDNSDADFDLDYEGVGEDEAPKIGSSGSALSGVGDFAASKADESSVPLTTVLHFQSQTNSCHDSMGMARAACSTRAPSADVRSSPIGNPNKRVYGAGSDVVATPTRGPSVLTVEPSSVINAAPSPIPAGRAAPCPNREAEVCEASVGVEAPPICLVSAPATEEDAAVTSGSGQENAASQPLPVGSRSESVCSVVSEDCRPRRSSVGSFRRSIGSSPSEANNQPSSSAAILSQLMRLQAQLAEESHLRTLAEERFATAASHRHQMDERLKALQQAHASATQSAAASRRGVGQLEANIAALQQEGAAMSRQLGEERTKGKELTAALAKAEKQLQSFAVSLQGKEEDLEQTKARFKEQSEQMRAAQTHAEKVRKEAEEQEEVMKELVEENENLKHIIDQLKASNEEGINDTARREHDITASFEHDKGVLMGEIEGLRSQLRRSALEHERELVLAEREVAAANQRSQAAEVRAMEASRASTDAAREVSTELISLSNHANKLQEQLREKAHQLTVAHQQLQLQKEEQACAQLAEVSSLQTQLATALRSGHDAQTQLNSVIEELRRERQQWKQREESLVEAVQELRSAVRNANKKADPVGGATRGGNVGDHVLACITAEDHDSCGNGSIAKPELTPPSPLQPTTAVVPPRLVEKELARTATALAALRQEHQTLIHSHQTLAHQHDVLLEMYGEKEEELVRLLAERNGHYITHPYPH